MDFIRFIVHTGDLVPANATNDCSRFVHESQTYVTMTHTQHTIHACVLAAAKASARAMRAYAHTRSVNIAVANNIARAPLVVPTPHICISGYCGIAYGLLVAGRMQSRCGDYWGSVSSIK